MYAYIYICILIMHMCVYVYKISADRDSGVWPLWERADSCIQV